ncbi:hypothetical protein BX600DRAFT_508804 [Xylariales sp. PMI_506]|nr:hypothetical protein BX600DRAFT_508804 [Xylariales sp. PMI_506]
MVTTRSTTRAITQASSLWVHAPDRVTLFWVAVSLPLVIWDSIYVLGRPHTMEGGFMHAPLWTPYKLYGEVDHIYGWKAFEARNGFTAAQGSLNVIETLMYLAYVYIYYSQRKPAPVTGKLVLTGRPAAVASLLAFSAAVMTVSKTVLYWLNEYFSGFDNIGHNSLSDLIILWIIPNGAWLVFPTYMIFVVGNEILDGLTIAATGTNLKSD